MEIEAAATETAAVDEVLPESDNSNNKTDNKIDSNSINSSPMKPHWTTVEEPMEPDSDVGQCAAAGADS